MSDMQPGPEQVAAQLRKPEGELGTAVGYSMNKTNAPLYDLVLETMQITNGDSILEIGFGNGKLFDKLFSVANDLQVAGLDYSADMVSEATGNNAGPIQDGRLALKQGNSDAIPFADTSFDKVFCCNVIYFWDEPAAHLKEIYRVLKPGGIFYAGFRSRSSMQAFPFTQFGFTLYEAAEWEALIRANGFIHRGTTEGTEHLETDDGHFELTAYCVAAKK